MKVVFAGPTISAADVSAVLEGAELRPPARAGDVYLACTRGARAIGLIDGYFEGEPSVWHKEILWALSRGVAVFGASSMGALRAAELHSFGMHGVGAIFEAYRDGVLEDDDEVALRHGPQALGYVALSVPMVNIRATLEAAVAQNVVAQDVADACAARAKAAHFAQRSWDLVLGGDGALAAWVATGAVDQKRLDAVAMLEAMAGAVAGGGVDFTFRHTVMWEALVRAVASADPERVLILDQLRRDPEGYGALRRRVAVADGSVSEAEVVRGVTAFRMQHRLFTGAALAAWLDAHDMDAADLSAQVADDLRVTQGIAQDREGFFADLIAATQAEGRYAALSQRAAEMAHILAQAPQAPVHPTALLIWYFEQYLERPVPQDVAAFVAAQDFADRDDFEQMMARAYVLWHHEAEQQGAGALGLR